MKCSKCGQEISPAAAHPYQDKSLCDDCYLELTSTEKSCDPWATYLSSHSREQAGQKGEAGLSELEITVYEFIKRQGRATRQEVMRELGISAEDLAPQLNVLMHAELVREHGEGDAMYLFPVPTAH